MDEDNDTYCRDGQRHDWHVIAPLTRDGGTTQMGICRRCFEKAYPRRWKQIKEALRSELPDLDDPEAVKQWLEK